MKKEEVIEKAKKLASEGVDMAIAGVTIGLVVAPVYFVGRLIANAVKG